MIAPHYSARVLRVIVLIHVVALLNFSHARNFDENTPPHTSTRFKLYCVYHESPQLDNCGVMPWIVFNSAATVFKEDVHKIQFEAIHATKIAAHVDEYASPSIQSSLELNFSALLMVDEGERDYHCLLTPPLPRVAAEFLDLHDFHALSSSDAPLDRMLEWLVARVNERCSLYRAYTLSAPLAAAAHDAAATATEERSHVSIEPKLTRAGKLKQTLEKRLFRPPRRRQRTGTRFTAIPEIQMSALRTDKSHSSAAENDDAFWYNNTIIDNSSPFLRRFYYPQRPVIVRAAAAQWPAMAKWTRAYLRRVFSGADVAESNDGTYQCEGEECANVREASESKKGEEEGIVELDEESSVDDDRIALNGDKLHQNAVEMYTEDEFSALLATIRNESASKQPRRRRATEFVSVSVSADGVFEATEDLRPLWVDNDNANDDNNSLAALQPPEVVRKQLLNDSIVITRPAKMRVHAVDFLDAFSKPQVDANQSLSSLSHGSDYNPHEFYIEYTSLGDIAPALRADTPSFLSTLPPALQRNDDDEDAADDADDSSVAAFDLRMPPFIESSKFLIWIGGNTVAGVHFDEYDNVMCVIRGEKEWFIAAPGASFDEGYVREAHFAVQRSNSSSHRVLRSAAHLRDSVGLVFTHAPLVFNDVYNTSNTFDERADDDLDTEDAAAVGANGDIESESNDKNADDQSQAAAPRVLHGRLRAGDCLFLPAFWWHAVRSKAHGSEPAVAVNHWFQPLFEKKFPCSTCERSVSDEFLAFLDSKGT